MSFVMIEVRILLHLPGRNFIHHTEAATSPAHHAPGASEYFSNQGNGYTGCWPPQLTVAAAEAQNPKLWEP